MMSFAGMSATAEGAVDAPDCLIQQHGYSGFSHEDVALQVGTRKPSIRHFSTTAELAAMVARRYTHRVGEQLPGIEEKQSHGTSATQGLCRAVGADLC